MTSQLADPAATQQAAPGRACARCGAPMEPAQDWCLSCGAGAPGSLGSGPGWRSGAGVLAVTGVFALGAAAAAYAALSKGPAPRHVVTATVPAPPVASAPPTATVPPSTLGTPTTIKPLLPQTTIKVPKIPLAATTPTTTPPSTTPTTPPSSGGSPSTTSTGGSGAGSGESGSGETGSSEGILLDTNAASTYNPYAFPPSDFGDPSLAIDGDTSTAWTALVEPNVAPKMAEGLLVDLKSPRKLSAVEVITSTPGMTVQIFAANGATAPTSITAPAWVKLSPSFVDKTSHHRIKLRDAKRSFRFILLWISRAPAASVGTPQRPGHVAVNEVELFP